MVTENNFSIKSISDMIGITFKNVIITDDNTRMLFINDLFTCEFYHSQDCCEHVEIYEVHGDLSDLMESPLLMIDVATNNDTANSIESNTWTFYKFSTIKGSVTIRWIGESNGYYSEEVDFKVYKTKDNINV